MGKAIRFAVVAGIVAAIVAMLCRTAPEPPPLGCVDTGNGWVNFFFTHLPCQCAELEF